MQGLKRVRAEVMLTWGGGGVQSTAASARVCVGAARSQGPCKDSDLDPSEKEAVGS